MAARPTEAGEMSCGPCAARRRKLLEKRKQKEAQGKPVQAAALGAVLAVSEAAGKVIGIHGEVEHEDDREHGAEVSGLEAVVGGSQGAEPDR